MTHHTATHHVIGAGIAAALLSSAALAGCSPRTADALWAYARAWLYDHLGG